MGQEWEKEGEILREDGNGEMSVEPPEERLIA